MSRNTLVSKEFEEMLEMKELQSEAELGDFSLEIRLESQRHRKKIPASIFTNRNRASLRTSQIFIFVDEIMYETSLLPDDFVNFSKLNFQLDARRRLKVTGRRPVSLTDNLSRLPWLGFLDTNDKKAEVLFYTEPRVSRPF